VQAGQTFVYLAQPTERQRYRLQLRPVRLGAPVHEQFPVLSGLQPGEQVVVGDLSALSNGLTVEAGRPLP